MRIKYKALIALTIALIELALLPVFLSIGGRQIGTITQLFYAFLIGSVVSLSVSYMKDRMRGLMSIIRSNRLLLVVIIAGLLNDVISQLLLGIGSVGTNPIVAATVFRSWVIMAALLVPITLRQRVKRIQMLAIVIGFLGVYLLASGGTLLNINEVELPFIFILLGSAVCTVYPNLAMKRYNVDLIGAVAIFNVVSLLFITVMAVFLHTNIAIPYSPEIVLPILFLGIATYGIGTMLYYYALKTFGPLFVGNSILVVPFLTILLSAMILGTAVYSYYIIAALLLSVGIVLQRKFAGAPEHISSRKFNSKVVVYDVTSAFVNNRDPIIAHYLSGSNKALAFKADEDFEPSASYLGAANKSDCLIFSTKGEQTHLARAQLDFINEIIGTDSEDNIIIGIGAADTLDKSFMELFSES